MAIRKSYRFSERTLHNLKILNTIEAKEYERQGIGRKITEREIVEKAIWVYKELQSEMIQRPDISPELTKPLSVEVLTELTKVSDKLHVLFQKIQENTLLIRTVVNAMEDSAMNNEEKQNIVNSVSRFETLIQDSMFQEMERESIESKIPVKDEDTINELYELVPDE